MLSQTMHAYDNHLSRVPGNAGPLVPRPETRKHYFYFSTSAQNKTNAKLIIRRKHLDVVIPERSQYGFTAIGTAKTGAGLRLGARWVLDIDAKRFEVYPQWIHCASDGRVQIGLRKLRQLPTDKTGGIVARTGDLVNGNWRWSFAMLAIFLVVWLAMVMAR